MMCSSWEKQKGDPRKHSEVRLYFLALACSMRFVLWPKKQNAFDTPPQSIMLQDEIKKHVKAGAIGQLVRFLFCKHGHLGSIPSTYIEEEEEEEVMALWWRQLGVAYISPNWWVFQQDNLTSWRMPSACIQPFLLSLCSRSCHTLQKSHHLDSTI